MLDLYSLGDFADSDDRENRAARPATAGVYKPPGAEDNRIIGTPYSMARPPTAPGSTT